MQSILIHTCCGFCGFSALKNIENQFDVKCFWYNPNIHPLQEYEKRLGAFKLWAGKEKHEMIVDLYEDKDWFKMTAGMENNDDLRCLNCYKMRMEKTVQVAKREGIRYFTTTLLVSPYQKHEKIKLICLDLADENNINFYYFDGRTDFYKNKSEYHKFGFYSQKYCGCMYSKRG